jgi:histidine triad (HIT) family protein
MTDATENCIFCHIASGKVPSKKVYEDEKVVGVLDINPASPGHVLIIPKKHIMILPQMSDEDIGHAFNVAKKLSLHLLRNIKAKGTNIFVANGAAAGQKAPHFMIHVIPRDDNDKLKLYPHESIVDDAALEALKQEILPKVKEAFGLADEKPIDLKASVQKGEQVPKKELDFDALSKVLDDM